MLLDFINLFWVKILISSVLVVETILIVLFILWSIFLKKPIVPKIIYLDDNNSEIPSELVSNKKSRLSDVSETNNSEGVQKVKFKKKEYFGGIK